MVAGIDLCHDGWGYSRVCLGGLDVDSVVGGPLWSLGSNNASPLLLA